jgi:hypothetical protein
MALLLRRRESEVQEREVRERRERERLRREEAEVQRRAAEEGEHDEL